RPQPRAPRPRPRTGLVPSPQRPYLRWAAAAALALCGVAHFPLHRGTAAPYAYGLSVGIATLCLLLALGLLPRAAVSVLAVGALFPGALAVAHVMETRVPSPAVTQALDTGGTLAALAALIAAVAAFAALVATVTRVRVHA
ncbi:hypothetical protein OK074_8228, partial [Actinobacteria bacterium OK074]